MVTGEAGSGKTRVLQELVRRQADSYLRGQTNKLFLYVNAQGRALARLNEALATELQDLRVNLTYHSVATLARVGIVIPVIDGFDELLGVSGYDDAFSSLAQFLEQMEGQGCLVASARSVYYEAEFLARAGKESATGDQAWTHVPGGDRRLDRRRAQGAAGTAWRRRNRCPTTKGRRWRTGSTTCSRRRKHWRRSPCSLQRPRSCFEMSRPCPITTTC